MDYWVLKYLLCSVMKSQAEEPSSVHGFRSPFPPLGSGFGKLESILMGMTGKKIDQQGPCLHGVSEEGPKSKLGEGKSAVLYQGWPSLLEKAVFNLLGRLTAGRNGKEQLRSCSRKRRKHIPTSCSDG